MGTLIDWHSHWIPRPVIDLLRQRRFHPRVVNNAQGESVLLAQPWAGHRALNLAVETFGADRILFGTDFPPLPTVEDTVAAFDAVGLAAEDRNLIRTENGIRLLEAKNPEPELASAFIP